MLQSRNLTRQTSSRIITMDALRLLRTLREKKAAAAAAGADTDPATRRDDERAAPYAATLSAAAPCPRMSLHPGALPLHVVHGIGTVHYVNHALLPADADACLALVDDAAARLRAWVRLRNRSVVSWGGNVGPRGLEDAEALPPFLSALIDGLVDAGLYPPTHRPNHVLVNEYQPGQGIMAHTDGPAYYPMTCTVSLGGAALMRFHEGRQTVGELLLQPGSLVAFSGDAYTALLHSISEDSVDVMGATAPCLNSVAAGVEPGQYISRGRRVSLTFRHVPLAIVKAAVDGATSGSSDATMAIHTH